MTQSDHELNRLLARYAQAVPETEAGANFMPGVWQRIEARRGVSFKLAAYARVLAMGAASLCLAAGLLELSSARLDSFSASRYVDVLNDDDSAETLAFADVVSSGHPAEIDAQGTK
ncbi:MAG: hypothetical protein IT162_21650 [Bryobacterales bacterium]|nr:hypothetical protein [Bryobacterales bacterium]